jgi:hypothetical protein
MWASPVTPGLLYLSLVTLIKISSFLVEISLDHRHQLVRRLKL